MVGNSEKEPVQPFFVPAELFRFLVKALIGVIRPLLPNDIAYESIRPW